MAEMSRSQGFQLPGWLLPNSNILPEFYKQVWEMVRDDKSCVRSTLQREVLVDTNKIFPLLLTSQLSTDILGYIWSLANKKYAGQLTEQELYIVLALVALAQASYPFNTLQVLTFIRVPPIPSLDINLLTQVKLATPSKCESQPNGYDVGRKYEYQSNTSVRQNHLYHHNEKADGDIINHTKRHRGSLSEIKNQGSSSSTDSGDDFSEFQSAPTCNVPNIAILDSRLGSAIGSRLANHNLSSKKIHEKSKKYNPIKTQYSNSQTFNFDNSTNINTESFNTERLSELFPKCSVPKSNQSSMTVILKDTVIRNNESMKIVDDHVVEELNNDDTDYDDFGNFVSAEILPSKNIQSKQLDASYSDLMNLHPAEDKYSALRALVEEPSISENANQFKTQLPVEETIVDVNAVQESQSGDDFGDFVSAEQPSKQSSESDLLSIDLLTNFELNHDESHKKSDASLMQEISDAFNALGMQDSAIQKHCLSEDYVTDKIITKNINKEDKIFVNGIDVGNNAVEHLHRSSSVPSLDLKCFLVSSQDDYQSAENMHQTIYSEWKQYMESCVLLLQVAANIFTNISSESTLRQVIASAQGYNFLCNLAEVAAVCRRVNFSHKEMDINIMGFDDLLMDIDKIWALMEPFYADIPIVSELPVWPSQADNVTCSLCLTVITSDGVVYNDNNYHLTCANLWLNCINSNLPVLRYPLNH